MSVRVRFAPSPTGYLHVGGLRTALYNYLFARHLGGKMVLRIEDTDRTRYVEGATENLIKYLEWAGISFDEGPHVGGDFGPYTQSERFDLYSQYAMQLIDKGKAYYAFDTSEELEEMRARIQASGGFYKYDRMAMRNQFTISDEDAKQLIQDGTPYVVRLKVPHEQDVVFQDIIRGTVVVKGNEVDDQILLKSDGFPTYHLANVVDDHLMQISHVIRGEEWLPSTPKHVLLYQAFGWECPVFAHLPLLLNKDKSKLSKRQGDVAVEDYVAKGYFKEAFVNFIALLGWNPTADREIYSLDELIEYFNLEKVNKSGAIFDINKLNWMNAQYLRAKSIEKLTEHLVPYLESINFNYKDRDYLAKVIELFKERIENLYELPESVPYMFSKPTNFDEDFIKKHWKEHTNDLVIEYIDKIRNLEEWTYQSSHDFTIQWIEQKGMKLRDIVHPLRIAVTGKSGGAGLFETLALLDKQDVIERLEYFMKTILPK